MLAFFGSFLLAGGSARALLQPFEFMMLGGSAIGFLFASNTIPSIKKMGKYFKYCITAPHSEESYLELLKCCYELGRVHDKDGSLGLDEHLPNPDSSPIFSKFASINQNQDGRDFLCNNMDLLANNASTISEHSFDEHLELEIEQYEAEANGPYKTMSMLVDTMPALGICAAVLGIILSMAYLDAPAEELGKHIGAALFGTFLGVFMAYGLFKPISIKFSKFASENTDYLRVIHAFLNGRKKGYDPIVSVMIANKSVPPRYRTPDHTLKTEVRS